MNTFQVLNGLTFAALLFVVASGFTLIFGLLRIVNLAHGALYLIGGYIGYTVGIKTGSFVLGGVCAMLGVAFIGFLLDEGLLRFVETMIEQEFLPPQQKDMVIVDSDPTTLIARMGAFTPITIPKWM